MSKSEDEFDDHYKPIVDLKLIKPTWNSIQTKINYSSGTKISKSAAYSLNKSAGNHNCMYEKYLEAQDAINSRPLILDIEQLNNLNDKDEKLNFIWEQIKIQEKLNDVHVVYKGCNDSYSVDESQEDEQPLQKQKSSINNNSFFDDKQESILFGTLLSRNLEIEQNKETPKKIKDEAYENWLAEIVLRQNDQYDQGKQSSNCGKVPRLIGMPPLNENNPSSNYQHNRIQHIVEPIILNKSLFNLITTFVPSNGKEHGSRIYNDCQLTFQEVIQEKPSLKPRRHIYFKTNLVANEGETSLMQSMIFRSAKVWKVFQKKDNNSHEVYYFKIKNYFKKVVPITLSDEYGYDDEDELDDIHFSEFQLCKLGQLNNDEITDEFQQSKESAQSKVEKDESCDYLKDLDQSSMKKFEEEYSDLNEPGNYKEEICQTYKLEEGLVVNNDSEENYRLYAKIVVFSNDYDKFNAHVYANEKDFLRDQWIAILYNQNDNQIESFEIRRLDNFNKVYIIENSLGYSNYSHQTMDISLDVLTMEEQQNLKLENKTNIKNDVLILTFTQDNERIGIKYYEICEKVQENQKKTKDNNTQEKEYQLFEVNESKRNELVLSRIYQWTEKEKGLGTYSISKDNKILLNSNTIGQKDDSKNNFQEMVDLLLKALENEEESPHRSQYILENQINGQIVFCRIDQNNKMWISILQCRKKQKQNQKSIYNFLDGGIQAHHKFNNLFIDLNNDDKHEGKFKIKYVFDTEDPHQNISFNHENPFKKMNISESEEFLIKLKLKQSQRQIVLNSDIQNRPRLLNENETIRLKIGNLKDQICISLKIYGKSNENTEPFSNNFLSQSSDVYPNPIDNKSICQNYQVCVQQGQKEYLMFLTVYEFKITYTGKQQSENDDQIALIGIKQLILSGDLTLEQKDSGKIPYFFVPIFDHNNKIQGTKLLLLNTDFINLHNKESTDFQFKNQLVSSCYEEFNTSYKDHSNNIQQISVLIVESKLNNSILKHHSSFTLSDYHFILMDQIRVVLNMCPMNIIDLLYDEQCYDLFQPLQFLNGHCRCDYLITKPQDLEKVLQDIDFEDGTIYTRKSLLERFQQNIELDEVKQDFLNFVEITDLKRKKFEITSDLFSSNCIARAFQLSNPQIASCKLLIEKLFNETMTERNYNLTVSLIDLVLDNEDPFKCFIKFFQDFEDDMEKGQEQNYIQFTKLHQGNELLPTYSNLEKEMIVFDYKYEIGLLQMNEYNKNIESYIEDQIISNYKNKDEASCTFQVQHFSADFRFKITNDKIYQFWLLQDDKIDKIENQQFDGLALSKMMSDINEKYPNEIDKFITIRGIIDSQFEKTSRFFLKQGFFYFVGYYIPFLLQIFYFTSPRGIFWANMLCLLTNIGFYYLEIIQMRIGGIKKYLKEFYNVMDSALFYTYCYYFTIRIINFHHLLPANQPSKSDITINQLSIMVILNSLLIVQGFIKMMFFLRVSEKFGKLVQLVGQCLIDVVSFSIFFLGWIFLFGILLRVLGMDIDHGDYPDLNEVAIFGIQIYRNSVGDDSPPGYTFWSKQINENQSFVPQLMIGVICYYFIILRFSHVYGYLNIIYLKVRYE